VLFNSIEFLLFLLAVFAVYWAMNRWTASDSGLRLQNLLLLGASYLFYAWWDWRFLGLIAFSTLVDYFVGGQIAKANIQQLQENARPEARSPRAKQWLIVSLLTNLGLLAVFKYTNFFLESWVSAWSAMGVEMRATTW
jgi:D-alanyl-lipoteichoic acid acyltransferase DltB (MBOAT superfamily)